MELCTKGSLEDAIKNKISDSELMKYLTQIIRSLMRITRKYPDFRHNDLWCANVFVTGRGALLGDFGWSRIKKNGTNPAVNTANGPLAQTDTGKWGVGPQTDARYDSHLILNDVRTQITSKGGYPKCKAFLDWAVPVGYRGNSDLHVTQMRLKYRDPCPGLPTIDQIIASKYLKGFKLNANALAAGRALLRKTKTRKPLAARPRSINLQRSRRPRLGSENSRTSWSPRKIRRLAWRPGRTLGRCTGVRRFQFHVQCSSRMHSTVSWRRFARPRARRRFSRPRARMSTRAITTLGTGREPRL